MLPALFTTQEEIAKKIRAIARAHIFENAQIILHIFYDVFKISYYALKRKNERVKSKGTVEVILKRKEVARLVGLIDYHHTHDKAYSVDRNLSQCFGQAFTEGDALKFFENYVEGNTKDRFGRAISIDLDDGIKFMCKILIPINM